MGKTSTLFYYKNQLEAKFPSSFHYLLQLQKFSNYFFLHGSKEINVSNLLEILAVSNGFDKKVFWELFNDGNVFLLFDGYDEISPNFSTYVTKLIKFCQNKKNHVWVSTRAHFTKEVEIAFNAPSFRILPFSNQDKIDFLVKFWRQTGSETKEELEKIAEVLVQKLMSTVNYKTFCDFIGIPLQIRMLAEIFTKNFGESMDSFLTHQKTINFYKFFNEFIRIKVMIRKQKGKVAFDEEVLLLVEEVNIIQFHKAVALTQIFEPRQISKLPIGKINRKLLTNEVIARLGILHKSKTGDDFQFVHQTFAEFFVSRFMIDLVFSEDNEEKMTSFMKVIVDILTFNKFNVVRTFLNSAFEMQNILELHLKTFKSALKIIEDEEILQLMTNLVNENQLNLIRFVFDAVDGETTMLKSLLIQVDKMNANLLQIAAKESSIEILQALWDEILTKSNENCVKMLMNKDGYDQNMLFYAVKNKNHETFKFVVDTCKGILSDENFRELLQGISDNHNILYESFMFAGNKLNLEILWDIYLKVFGVFEMKKSVLKTRGFLLAAVINQQSSGILQSLISRAEQLFAHEEMKTDFESDSKNFVSSFYNLTYEMLDDFWYLFTYLFKDIYEQRQMLMKCGANSRNVIMSLVQNYDFNVFKKLFAKVEEVLGNKSNDLKMLFLSKDANGNDLLNYIKTCGDNEIPEFMISYVEKNFNETDRIKFYRNGRNRFNY